MVQDHCLTAQNVNLGSISDLDLNIHSIFLDSNNLTDHAMSTLLSKVMLLKSLTYCNNELGILSVKILSNIMLKQIPDQTQSIRLEMVKLQPAAADVLFNSLALSYLQDLAIADIKVGQSSSKNLFRQLP